MAHLTSPPLTDPGSGTGLGQGPGVGGKGTVLAALPRQRGRGMLAVAVLLIVMGALGGLAIVTSLNDQAPVVVMARDVAIGQTITRGDVATAMVAGDARIARIPASQLDQVTGRVAAIDLRAGMLVPPSGLTTVLTPGRGQQLVPVAVKPSRLPARGLRPGDLVLVVPLPAGPATAGAAGAGQNTASDGRPVEAKPIAATVSQVAGPDADGLMVVDLLVEAGTGPALAVAAGDGHVTLNLTSRRR